MTQLTEQRPAAVLLHGFLRTGASMLPMAVALRRSGYAVTRCPTFLYQNRTLPDAARELALEIAALQRLHGHVDLVTHSFGGLLARAVMSHAPVRRAVLLAPPNQGAHMAELARRFVPVHKLGWDPLAQILPGIPRKLPRGPAEIGIITGGTGDERGFNPLLDGDNDQTVRVSEARLEGVDHFVVLPVRHTFLMAHREVQRLTLGFLRHGAFPDSELALPQR